MEAGNLNEKNLLVSLVEAQSAVIGTDGAASAKRYAASVLHETVSPLEAMNNLIYIVRQMPEGPEPLQIYIKMIESQLQRLNTIVQQSLEFCSK